VYLVKEKDLERESCPVPDKIDREISKKGTVDYGGETQTVFLGIQIQSGAGELAARYDH
jgi:hypothetical protein